MQRLHLLVTQNVDGLHQRAGSTDVIELHGNIGRVICLGCGTTQARETVQLTLIEQNPSFFDVVAETAPDGDADLEHCGLDEFSVPQCGHCGGMLKPDVVFFGEGIPRTRVDAALAALEEADAMLVVGSSLMVYSGYRFCEHAHGMGKPIAAINRGRTRADHLFTLKVEHGCGEVLTDLVEALCAIPSLAVAMRTLVPRDRVDEIRSVPRPASSGRSSLGGHGFDRQRETALLVRGDRADADQFACDLDTEIVTDRHDDGVLPRLRVGGVPDVAFDQ